MRRLLLALVFSGSLVAGDHSGVHLSGVWIGQIPNRNGDLQDIAFQFVQKGTKLSGKLYGDYHSSPIIEGIIAGHLITFVVMAQEQAGNQINETRLRFTGSIKDGQIELMRERESSRNAGNSGEVMSRGNARQSFKLKRLY